MSTKYAPEDTIDYYYWCFLNNDKQEYLKMRFCPGDTKNSFYAFEVGYTNCLPRITKLAFSKLSPFTTNSGIHLGLTKTELINIKGNDYQQKEQDNTNIYKKTYQTLTYCRLKADYNKSSKQSDLCETYYFSHDTLRMFCLSYGCEP